MYGLLAYIKSNQIKSNKLKVPNIFSTTGHATCQLTCLFTTLPWLGLTLRSHLLVDKDLGSFDQNVGASPFARSLPIAPFSLRNPSLAPSRFRYRLISLRFAFDRLSFKGAIGVKFGS